MAETVPPAPDENPTPMPEKPLGEGGVTPPIPPTSQGENISPLSETTPVSPSPSAPRRGGGEERKPPSVPPEEPRKPEPEGGPSSTPPGGTTSAKKLFLWFVSIILGLLGVFSVLLMWGLLGGNVDNPLFGLLGM